MRRRCRRGSSKHPRRDETDDERQERDHHDCARKREPEGPAQRRTRSFADSIGLERAAPAQRTGGDGEENPDGGDRHEKDRLAEEQAEARGRPGRERKRRGSAERDHESRQKERDGARTHAPQPVPISAMSSVRMAAAIADVASTAAARAGATASTHATPTTANVML